MARDNEVLIVRFAMVISTCLKERQALSTGSAWVKITSYSLGFSLSSPMFNV
jgi:hypothetical protein